MPNTGDAPSGSNQAFAENQATCHVIFPAIQATRIREDRSINETSWVYLSRPNGGAE